jgi:hypothetical protein
MPPLTAQMDMNTKCKYVHFQAIKQVTAQIKRHKNLIPCSLRCCKFNVCEVVNYLTELNVTGKIR